MANDAVGKYEGMAALATLLRTSVYAQSHLRAVVDDPEFSTDARQFPYQVRNGDTGKPDGTIITHTGEDEPQYTRGMSGKVAVRRSTLTLDTFVPVDATFDDPASPGETLTSKEYLDLKLADYERITDASRDLGLAGENFEVTHEGLYAPTGMEPHMEMPEGLVRWVVQQITYVVERKCLE